MLLKVFLLLMYYLLVAAAAAASAEQGGKDTSATAGPNLFAEFEQDPDILF